jgi:hypothetical protein
MRSVSCRLLQDMSVFTVSRWGGVWGVGLDVSSDVCALVRLVHASQTFFHCAYACVLFMHCCSETAAHVRILSNSSV